MKVSRESEENLEKIMQTPSSSYFRILKDSSKYFHGFTRTWFLPFPPFISFVPFRNMRHRITKAMYDINELHSVTHRPYFHLYSLYNFERRSAKA